MRVVGQHRRARPRRNRCDPNIVGRERRAGLAQVNDELGINPSDIVIDNQLLDDRVSEEFPKLTLVLL